MARQVLAAVTAAWAFAVLGGACGSDEPRSTADTGGTGPTTSDAADAGPTTAPRGTDGTTAPDEGLVEASVIITSTQLVDGQDGPAVKVTGQLPTPCHQLAHRARISNGDAVTVRVYSLVDPTVMCPQVIEPFEAVVPLPPLDPLEPGPREVTLNGDRVGTVER